MVNEECNFCKESKLRVGDKTVYGSIILHKNGDENNGWFATLSPKTGGDPNKDFTVQLMPKTHLTHISEISKDEILAQNYGIIFAKLSNAINIIMKEEGRQNENEEKVVRIGIYGKSKHTDEHFHIKLFPWAGKIGQPYTVDSSFEKSQIYLDENGKEFVKQEPVRKVMINENRINDLYSKFIEVLNK